MDIFIPTLRALRRAGPYAVQAAEMIESVLFGSLEPWRLRRLMNAPAIRDTYSAVWYVHRAIYHAADAALEVALSREFAAGRVPADLAGPMPAGEGDADTFDVCYFASWHADRVVDVSGRMALVLSHLHSAAIMRHPIQNDRAACLAASAAELEARAADLAACKLQYVYETRSEWAHVAPV